MKKLIFTSVFLLIVIFLFTLFFNIDYYLSGFYKDEKTGKYFYTDFVGSVNNNLDNKVKLSVPVFISKPNGDTLQNIDFKSFVRINNFYKDDFYVYRIIEKADFLSVIADPLNEIKYEFYFKNSFYQIINDSIFYDSPAGGSCNGFLMKKSRTFHVLDIDNLDYDCAIFNNIVFINGCKLSEAEFSKLKNEIKGDINFARKNKNYKKPIEIMYNITPHF